MAWMKRVTISYFRIEAAEEDYFSKFYDTCETMLSTEHNWGDFEAGELKYFWKLRESTDTGDTKGYVFTLVKERAAWPVWFTEDGDVREVTLPEGGLGEISYALINPTYKFIVCFSAGGGGVSGFKKMLGQFSPEGVVRLSPLYEEEIDERVLLWDNFKKLSIHMKMPSGEDVTEFANTKTGSLMQMLGYLGGLKGDISISVPGKENLSAMMVKELLTELLANDLCTSLTVRGSDFESSSPEQFDIKNAQIKHVETIEIEGNYINYEDAKVLLMRALNARSRELFSANN